MKMKQNTICCETCGYHLIRAWEYKREFLKRKKRKMWGTFTIVWVKVLRGNENANTCTYNNNNKGCKRGRTDHRRGEKL